MNVPRTIAEYLDQLRAALRGADPALIQDALYDAEEHLRAELAEQPARGEAEMLQQVVGSYGAPDEVAEIYRDQEIKVQRAIRPPPPPVRRSAVGRFFGVAAEGHTYGALFDMLLSLATGIFYFTWAVAGILLSSSFSLLIIGIPFLVLFFGSVRGLSLLEGRIVETMLGVRMPRRPPYPASQGEPILKRIGAMFLDARSWSTLLYMLLMLPLGIFYFTVTVIMLALSLGLAVAPLVKSFGFSVINISADGFSYDGPGWAGSFGLCVLGILLLFATLHVVRGLGRLHGQMAKQLLVASAAA